MCLIVFQKLRLDHELGRRLSSKASELFSQFGLKKIFSDQQISLEINKEELYKKSESAFSWCFCRRFAKAGFQFNAWVFIFSLWQKFENLHKWKAQTWKRRCLFSLPKNYATKCQGKFSSLCQRGHAYALNCSF